jgi:hypothetical protein
MEHGTPEDTTSTHDRNDRMKRTAHLPWHTLTPDEQAREYAPYALYVSLDEYLTLRRYE